MGFSALLTYAALSVAVFTAQSAPAVTGNVLATVRLPTAVTVGGSSLPAGTYELRLTGQHPDSPAGQPADAQEWIEFAVHGNVVAREIAEILRDDDLPPVGASSQRAAPGARVELLKGDEFVRISVKRDHDRYLIHLPVSAVK